MVDELGSWLVNLCNSKAWRTCSAALTGPWGTGLWGLSRTTNMHRHLLDTKARAVACNCGATPTYVDGPTLSSLPKNNSTYLGFSVAIYILFSTPLPPVTTALKSEFILKKKAQLLRCFSTSCIIPPYREMKIGVWRILQFLPWNSYLNQISQAVCFQVNPGKSRYWNSDAGVQGLGRSLSLLPPPFAFPVERYQFPPLGTNF